MDAIWIEICILFAGCIMLLVETAYLEHKIRSLDKENLRMFKTIKTLSEALATINDGYKDHEKRIQKLEKVEDVSETEGQYIYFT